MKDCMVQSPVGLVPKSGGKTRLIFHFSYHFKNGNQSVNYWTPGKISGPGQCCKGLHKVDGTTGS